MKKQIGLTIIALGICTMFVRAQGLTIPNASYETWDNLGNFSTPDAWPSSDLLWHFNGLNTKTVSQDLYSHSGKYAVRIAPDTATGKIWPGFIVCKFAISNRPKFFTFYYSDSLNNVDSGAVAVGLSKQNTGTGVHDSLGGAVWKFPIGYVKAYTYVEIPLIYVDSVTVPDSASITIQIKSGATSLRPGHVLVDDANLTLHSAGIEMPDIMPIASIFPNPSSGRFSIKTSNMGSVNSIEICNIAGKRVRYYTYATEMPSEIDLTDCPTGVYLVRIDSKSGMETGKLMLMR